MKRREFIIKGTLTGAVAIGTYPLIKKILSLNPLEQKIEKMIDKGMHEINQSFTLEQIMLKQGNCEKEYSQINMAAITHNQSPNHNIVIYAPENWTDMQISIFEKSKKYLTVPYEPGNFTLQLIPYEEKLEIYYNNTGGILDTRTNTLINLDSETQKQAEKLYNKLWNIVHSKETDLKKCYPTKYLV
jgi:hypothetical protein